MADKIIIVNRVRSLLDVTNETVDDETALEIWESLEDLSVNSNVTVEDFETVVREKLPGIVDDDIVLAADNSDLDAILKDLKGRQT